MRQYNTRQNFSGSSGAPAGTAVALLPPLLPLAWYFIHMQFALCYICYVYIWFYVVCIYNFLFYLSLVVGGGGWWVVGAGGWCRWWWVVLRGGGE